MSFTSAFGFFGLMAMGVFFVYMTVSVRDYRRENKHIPFKLVVRNAIEREILFAIVLAAFAFFLLTIIYFISEFVNFLS